jgi:hypothetical protein
MKSSRRLKPIARDSGLRPPRISGRAARRLGLALLWVGTCVGVLYGLRQVDSYAAAVRAADTSWAMDWVKLPPANVVPEWVIHEVATKNTLYDPEPVRAMGINDPRLCEALAETIQKSPWIAKIRRISKQADGRVRVHADFRTYLTYLVHDGKGYLVDEEGFRLPREETESRLPGYEMILLEGVQEPPPAYGEAWTGEAVKNGLKLVKLLQSYCPAGPKAWIRAVDVSNYGGRKNPRNGWLSIRTIHARTRIQWGYPPGQEYDTEPPAEQKLAYLQKAFSKYGQFPDGKIFDLRDRKELLISDAP